MSDATASKKRGSSGKRGFFEQQPSPPQKKGGKKKQQPAKICTCLSFLPSSHSPTGAENKNTSDEKGKNSGVYSTEKIVGEEEAGEGRKEAEEGQDETQNSFLPFFPPPSFSQEESSSTKIFQSPLLQLFFPLRRQQSCCCSWGRGDGFLSATIPMHRKGIKKILQGAERENYLEGKHINIPLKKIHAKKRERINLPPPPLPIVSPSVWTMIPRCSLPRGYILQKRPSLSSLLFLPRESILSRSHGRRRGFLHLGCYTDANGHRAGRQPPWAGSVFPRCPIVLQGGGVTREGHNTQQEAAAPSLGRLPLDVGGGGGEPGRPLLLTTQQPEGGRERSGRNPGRIFHGELIWKFELSSLWWTDPIRRRLRKPGNYR